ncbi:MAG: GNAT family N-acetyltransferase [Promethearchaeota archaeon]
MKINLIPKTNQNLIDRCTDIAKADYFENIVLLGDLFLPCIKLTDIYGIFDNNNLISFYTVFQGFENPSVILPNNVLDNEAIILSNLYQTLPKEFMLVSFILKESDLNDYFTVTETHSEYCMISNQSKFRPHFSSHKFKQVREGDFSCVDSFYKSNKTLPWNPIQLESNFYFYNKLEDKIIACGGTHFETSDAAQLGNILVLPEFRRNSMGITLASTITREILKKKSFATLFVTQNNRPAINLYKKIGFFHYKPVSIFYCRNDD